MSPHARAKHDPYCSYYEPMTGMQTYRCGNCDAEAHLGVWQLEDEDCPNTGAPDWEAIDRERHREGMKRILERMRADKKKPAQGA